MFVHVYYHVLMSLHNTIYENQVIVNPPLIVVSEGSTPCPKQPTFIIAITFIYCQPTFIIFWHVYTIHYRTARYLVTGILSITRFVYLVKSCSRLYWCSLIYNIPKKSPFYFRSNKPNCLKQETTPCIACMIKK